jgi:hypothetical protein
MTEPICVGHGSRVHEEGCCLVSDHIGECDGPAGLKTCKRCGHKWIGDKFKPRQCSRCHSALWKNDRVRAVAPERKAKASRSVLIQQDERIERLEKMLDRLFVGFDRLLEMVEQKREQ